MSATSVIGLGLINQNVRINGTLSVRDGTTLNSLNAISANVINQTITQNQQVQGQTTTTSLNVTGTTNTRDAATGVLTAGAMQVAGGCVLQADLSVQGNTTLSTVKSNAIQASSVTASGNIATATLTTSSTSTLSGNINVGQNALITSSSAQDITTNNNLTTAAISTLGSIYAALNIQAANQIRCATASVASTLTTATLNTTTLNAGGASNLSGATTFGSTITSNSTQDVVPPSNTGGAYTAAIATQGGVYAAKTITAGSTTDSTSSTSASSLNTAGGLSVAKATNLGTTLTVGGNTTLNSVNATSINNTGNETIGGMLNFPSTVMMTGITTATTTVQGGSNIQMNALRLRTNDATNTSARISLANAGTSATTYYDSGITLYNLGNMDTSTNYERIAFGINAAGGYLNYLYGGTGIARPFNLMGGASFSTGGNMTLSGAANLNNVNATGVITAGNVTDATSATSTTSSLNTAGGLSVTKAAYVGTTLNLPNTADYTGTVSTNTYPLNVAGGAYIAQSLGLGPSTMIISSAISATSSTQTGTTPNSNILRLRSNDATNSTVRVSIANTAMANSYYDSSFVAWALGSSAASTNYERMIIGANSSGGYVNYLYGGTGTLKPFNILGGSIFSMGGALQLNTSLNINGVTRIASPTSPYTLTEPPALPSVNGMYLTSTTTGVQSWATPSPMFTGDGSSAAPTAVNGASAPRLYILTQTLNNTSGQIAFYLTNNGLSGGTPLGTFLGIWFNARLPSANNNVLQGPFASEAYRGTNGVVANVLMNRNSTIVVGGTANGLQAAATGTIVTCFAYIL